MKEGGIPHPVTWVRSTDSQRDKEEPPTMESSTKARKYSPHTRPPAWL